MTESRVAYQTAFAGLASDQVAGDVIEKCRVMLMEEPATRTDYTRAYVRYLARYCNLDEAMKPWWRSDDLMAFLQQHPSYRTIALRCQELMKSDATLAAPAAVTQERQRQRRQGRIR